MRSEKMNKSAGVGKTLGRAGNGRAGWLLSFLLHKEREKDSGCWEVGQAAGSSKRLLLCYGDREQLLSIKREECMKRERLKLLEPVYVRGSRQDGRWRKLFAGNAEISEGLKVQRRGTGNNPHLVLYGLVPLWHRSRYLTGLTIIPK